MPLFLPLALALGASLHAQDPADTTTIVIPRLEQQVEVDGRLDEPVWANAARLSGFHQYQPVDSRPAEERTEVLVWYSPRAIHFGIIAHARNASSIRATLADRDNISSDDRVTIYLDTFHDRRRAYLFGVNPLGVQLDGVRTEGANSAGSRFGGTTDYNPDFYFESRGLTSDSGYVVEVRIPFTSLRYGSADVQRWGLQVVRDNAATGYEDTWTDTRRAGASFLAQAGTIAGLHGLERGVVAEAQPFVTAAANGTLDDATGRFERADPELSAGANVRLGFTRFTLDGTINPDFSQVESDAGLVTVNERFALFVEEKRPFFLEGIELFATPNQLVYTRRIEDPIAGAKLTGKLGPYSVAALSMVDELPGHDAVANIARVRRDIRGNSVAGFTVTDRERGGAFNRVLSADSRIVFARLYYFEGQLAGSWTRGESSGTVADPLWKAEVDRTGRHFGFNYQINGIGDGFRSELGFVPRTGVVTARVLNRFSLYGSRGAFIEQFTVFLGPNRVWTYDDFGRGGALEGNDQGSLSLNLRGGWESRLTLGRNFFRLPSELYADYTEAGTAAPYAAPAELSGLPIATLRLTSPIWQRANAELQLTRQAVPIFAEAAEGRESRAALTLRLRPTADIRVEGTGTLSRIVRDRDGSEFARTLIPRLKLEYQATRALFFRAVGEYRSERQDALTSVVSGAPLLVGGVPVGATAGGTFRHEWLVSYEPTPGTVAFFGYASTHRSPSATELSGFERTIDGLFLKLAYQYRRVP